MSYQSDPNQAWGQSPPPGGGQPSGYQPYPNQPYANQPFGGSSIGPTLAGWWNRVAATIIDSLIVAIPAIIIGAAVGNRFVGSGLISLGWLLYATLMVGSTGRTVGMRAVGLSCLDGATGTPIGYGRAFVRWLIAWLCFTIFFLPWVLDVLWPLWDDKNQTWHDMAAGSVVVTTP